MIKLCEYKINGEIIATLWLEKEKETISVILMFTDGRCIIKTDTLYPQYKTPQMCFINATNFIIDELGGYTSFTVLNKSTKGNMFEIAKVLKAQLYLKDNVFEVISVPQIEDAKLEKHK